MFDLMLKQAKRDFQNVKDLKISQVFVICETDTQKLESWVTRHLEPKGLLFIHRKGGDICEVQNHPRNIQRKYKELNINEKINVKSNLNFPLYKRKSIIYDIHENIFFARPNRINWAF